MWWHCAYAWKRCSCSARQVAHSMQRGVCMETHLFVAVECKKPWNFLNLTIYRQGNKTVVFALAEAGSSLKFFQNHYVAKFGRRAGMTLFSDLAKEMKACRDESISTETIRMQLCIVIWKHFGIGWLETFSCIQESRNITLPQGVDDLAVFNLYAYLNICLATAPLAKLAQGESGIPANLVRTAAWVLFLPPPARSMLRAFHQAVCLPLLRFQ